MITFMLQAVFLIFFFYVFFILLINKLSFKHELKLLKKHSLVKHVAILAAKLFFNFNEINSISILISKSKSKHNF